MTQFPIYEHLGVGIYQCEPHWRGRTDPPADRRPDRSRLPLARRDRPAVGGGRGHGIRVSVFLSGAPGWANGGAAEWAPGGPGTSANFAAAASRRYPGVRHWMIWGEPSKPSRFQPLVQATGRRLSARQRRGPRPTRACSTPPTPR